MNIKLRILKTLKNIETFYPFDDIKSIQDISGLTSLQNDEICIGLYENFPREKNERILITDKRLYLFRNKLWENIDFVNIEKVGIDFNENENVAFANIKNDAEYLTLSMKKGEKFLLPVKGRKGQFKDIFLFWRFLKLIVNNRS